jgi:AcrR family transcriptional regulator
VPIFALTNYSINKMSRNKELNQIIKDERREQILTAALKLFASKGLAAARMSELSKSTGISQGLVYHYYRSKEELFTSLISSAIEKMNSAAINLEKLDISSREKIILAVDSLLKGFNENTHTTDYYYLIIQTALSESFPQEARRIISSGNHIKYDVMTRIFKKGQEEGTVKSHPARDMATLFFATINGLALNKAIHGANYLMPDKDIILEMFLTSEKLKDKN